MSETQTPGTPGSEGPERPDHRAAKALFGWVEAKATPGILLFGVIGLSVFLVEADLFVDRHEYIDFANGLGFYGLWGFGAFAFAVLSGWPLGKLLRRDEDYYGEDDTQPADVEHPARLPDKGGASR